jgi:hypothetical protein
MPTGLPGLSSTKSISGKRERTACRSCRSNFVLMLLPTEGAAFRHERCVRQVVAWSEICNVKPAPPRVRSPEPVRLDVPKAPALPGPMSTN